MIDIDWGAFAAVAGVSAAAAIAVVALFAVALRLLATGRTDDAPDRPTAGERVAERPPAVVIGAVVCIGLAAAIVLYGLYLLIPQFHA